MVRGELKALQASVQSKEGKSRVLRLIPKMGKEIYQELKDRGEIDLRNVMVDGMPAGVQMLAVSSSIAADMLSDYDPKADGDLDTYLTWIIESAMRMMSAEYATHKVKNSFIIHNLYNYYRKVADSYERTGDYVKVAERFGISANENMIRKCTEICEERVL